MRPIFDNKEQISTPLISGVHSVVVRSVTSLGEDRVTMDTVDVTFGINYLSLETNLKVNIVRFLHKSYQGVFGDTSETSGTPPVAREDRDIVRWKTSSDPPGPNGTQWTEGRCGGGIQNEFRVGRVTTKPRPSSVRRLVIPRSGSWER